MAVPWNDEAREFRQTSGRILFAGSEREYRSRYPTLPVLTVGPKPLGSRKKRWQEKAAARRLQLDEMLMRMQADDNRF